MKPIALETCWVLFSYACLLLLFLPVTEKSTTSNKNPSKPPVVSVPPKAPEDKTPNTHFGVVIHDRGEFRCTSLFLLPLESVQRRVAGCLLSWVEVLSSS